MDGRIDEKSEQVSVSIPTCFVVEFLICHTLLVMVAVLVVFFATQFGVFDINPIWIGQGSLDGSSAGLWMSLIALEGIIVIISRRYAMKQVAVYREVLEEHQPEAADDTVHPDCDPETGLPTVYATK